MPIAIPIPVGSGRVWNWVGNWADGETGNLTREHDAGRGDGLRHRTAYLSGLLRKGAKPQSHKGEKTVGFLFATRIAYQDHSCLPLAPLRLRAFA